MKCQFLIYVAALAMAVLAGCSSVAPDKASAFQSSTAAVATSLDAALSGTDAVIAEGQVNAVLDREPPELFEKDFAPVLNVTTEAAMKSQFDALAAYAMLLKQITDKTYRGNFGSAVSSLQGAACTAIQDAASLNFSGGTGQLASASTVSDIKQGLGVFSGIASAVGEVAIDAYSQSEAYEIVKKHDADVASFCAALQQVLQKTDEKGKEVGGRGLVAISDAAYRQAMVAQSDYFSQLKARPDGTSEEAWRAYRGTIAKHYGELVVGRDQARAKILALRGALAKIASAHHALAQEDERTFFQEIDQAQSYLQFIFKSYETGKTPPTTGK